MKAKEIYQLLNDLIDIKIQLESAQDSYQCLIDHNAIVPEALAPLRLERVNRALEKVDQIEDALIQAHTDKTREERIANNYFD